MIKSASLTDSLNEAQLEAVTAPPGHMLILAGAGSGKTRVLVRRIAWLLAKEQISPFQILAVTFTNKAAREMRERIEQSHGQSLRGMWVGTFHGLAHRMLRAHWHEADLPEGFQIIDSADQYRVIRRLLKQRGLDEGSWPPKQIQWFINKQKEAGLRAAKVITDGDNFTETMVSIYSDYEKLCLRNGVIDFTELLLRSLELLRNKPDIRTHYQGRFKHILVDEFQDTNPIQYQWLRELAGTVNKMMVVGDDDQSIYSWRGAEVAHIQQFQQEYSPVKLVRLEQNYRSTQTILQAANAVIANNSQRLGKNLWTELEQGEPITLYEAFNERDEACYILNQISHWHQKNTSYCDIAIVYRSNAQSRILEEVLIREGIPYRIYGGLKFYDRAEIKDALAYLRLILNRDDDTAFERVVNLPTRGIGGVTLQRMREMAREHNKSLWQAAQILVQQQQLTARAGNAVSGFLQLIEQLDQAAQDKPLDELTGHMLNQSGLIKHYEKDRSERGQSKVENLEELLTSTNRYLTSNNNDHDPSEDLIALTGNEKVAAKLDGHYQKLSQFLQQVALEAGDNQADANSQCVNLMTLHSAKGLEFPILFMTGVEEGLFPHGMALNEEHGLEEERRLCYVGITRAMKKLYISFAQTRMIHGSEQYHRQSRFINEIPAELITEVRPKSKVKQVSLNKSSFSGSAYSSSQTSLSKPYSSKRRSILSGHHKVQSIPETPYRIGQKVQHKKFGAGVLMNYEGSGEQLRLQVEFESVGEKWLLASLAKLTICA